MKTADYFLTDISFNNQALPWLFIFWVQLTILPVGANQLKISFIWLSLIASVNPSGAAASASMAAGHDMQKSQFHGAAPIQVKPCPFLAGE
ncbi:hypothetical protein [Vogesella indigofera]|uniref:hypothetical protein n=1 Tax=Vogesella indigofera TaxID=45465 RepID=UPI00234E52E6|nr:hypothetical protein [Vogesella indigofera]MDC7696649.1 hypothetical protein [Vogesella indigofera]